MPKIPATGVDGPVTVIGTGPGPGEISGSGTVDTRGELGAGVVGVRGRRGGGVSGRWGVCGDGGERGAEPDADVDVDIKVDAMFVPE